MIKRGYKQMMRGIENERINQIIDAYVHSERDREIIKMSLLHDISYTNISDRLQDMVSPRTVQTVMNRWMPIIIEHLKR